MGKIIQVKADSPPVPLPPIGQYFGPNAVAILTDAEYQTLPSALLALVTLLQSKIPDPERSSTSNVPASALDAYRLSKTYTDQAVASLVVSGPTVTALSAAISDETTRAEGVEATLAADVSEALAASQGAAQTTNNLSDLANETTARTNLGLGTAATHAATDFDAAGSASGVQASSAQIANNLSDLASASAARTNLGLGSAATQASSAFDASGAAATAQAASLQKSSNLSDLTSSTTARTNLGLGSAATHASTDFDAAGAATGALAAALQKTNNLSDLSNASMARTNLGLGTAATQSTAAFDAAGSAATAQAASVQKTSNLSDLVSPSTSRTNLGLGTAATQPATWITPDQFNLGSDDLNFAAALAYGDINGITGPTDVVLTLESGKTYTLNSTHAWQSNDGSLTVMAWGATINYTGTGSAITEITNSGGNNPPTTKWFGGIYNATSASRFFDCTDVRSCLWSGCSFTVGNNTTPTPGVFVYLTNINAYCERNEVVDCRSIQTAQTVVAERGFKSTTRAVTFTAGSNQITDPGHNFVAGNDWARYATVGTSGLSANQTYYVATVIDANNYTLSTVPCDPFGVFPSGSTVTINSASAGGTAYNYASGSFARLQVRNLHITAGVNGYAQVQYKNSGPYDSIIGPFTGNVANGAGMIDFWNSRTQGDSTLGPFLCEASDDGHSVTGSNSTGLITLTNGAPVSFPLAVNQPVMFSKLVGGSNLVSEKLYYINTLPSSTTFTISATVGGGTLSLGSDITGGFFWNPRPWMMRWGQSTGQPPVLKMANTLRNFALYDPTQMKADGVTPAVPDGTVAVFQHEIIQGLLISNSQHYSGLDLVAGASALPTAPYNPYVMVSSGAPLDQSGTAYIGAASGKGIFLIDGTGNPLVGVDHSGNVTMPSFPGALLAETLLEFGSAKLDFTTSGGTTATDIVADYNTANSGFTVASNFLDCTFVAPSNGVVLVEMQMTLADSGTGTQVRLQINDVTSTPTMVVNSPMVMLKGASTTQLRPLYVRRFSGLTAGQTYIWRPQWSAGASVSATGSIGAQNGNVRMTVKAWK